MPTSQLPNERKMVSENFYNSFFQGTGGKYQEPSPLNLARKNRSSHLPLFDFITYLRKRRGDRWPCHSRHEPRDQKAFFYCNDLTERLGPEKMDVSSFLSFFSSRLASSGFSSTQFWLSLQGVLAESISHKSRFAHWFTGEGMTCSALKRKSSLTLFSPSLFIVYRLER